MTSDNPSFDPADLDSNTWYHVSDGRVRFNGALCIANETLGTVAVFSPRSDYWQFQRLTSDRPRYAIRSSALGVRKQLAACHVDDEIDGSKTQPCLRNSDGTDEQKWDIHEWDIGVGGNTTYRFVNVKNGTDYWLDVHPGNPPFMSSEVGNADQKAQQFVMESVSPIDDGAYSTTFTNMPTGSKDDQTTTETSTTSSPSSTNTNDDEYETPTSSGLSTGAQAGIGVGVGLAAILVGVLAFILWRRRRKSAAPAAAAASTTEIAAPAYHEGGYKYDQSAVGGGANWQQHDGGQMYHEVQGSDSAPTELAGDSTQTHELMGDQGYQGRPR